MKHAITILSTLLLGCGSIPVSYGKVGYVGKEYRIGSGDRIALLKCADEVPRLDRPLLPFLIRHASPEHETVRDVSLNGIDNCLWIEGESE